MKKIIAIVLILCMVCSGGNVFASAETVTAESSTMENIIKSLGDIILSISSVEIVSAILQQNFTENELLQIGPEKIREFSQEMVADLKDTIIKLAIIGDFDSQEAELEIIGFRTRLESIISVLAQELHN